MNFELNQVVIVGLVALSVAVVYLFIQNRKLKQQIRTEFLTINRDLKELSQIMLEGSFDKTHINYNTGPVSISDLEPHVSNELREELMRGGSSNLGNTAVNDEFNTENNLKDEYKSFVLEETNENYEDISEELKNEIEELELRDSSNEESVTRGDNLSELEPSFTENNESLLENNEEGDDELQEVFPSESLGNNVTSLVDDVLAQTATTSPILMDEININTTSKLSKLEIEKMTVTELQDVARSHKLKVKGKKNELMERINEFYNN